MMRTFVRDRSGHFGVNLTQDGRYRLYSVHRLVAVTWIGPAPSVSHLVMHKNDDPADNAASNLEYGLPADNSAQMVSRRRQARGERCGRSKLKASDVAVIRARLQLGHVQKRIAADFSISATVITDIKLGRIWRND